MSSNQHPPAFSRSSLSEEGSQCYPFFSPPHTPPRVGSTTAAGQAIGTRRRYVESSTVDATLHIDPADQSLDTTSEAFDVAERSHKRRLEEFENEIAPHPTILASYRALQQSSATFDRFKEDDHTRKRARRDAGEPWQDRARLQTPPAPLDWGNTPAVEPAEVRVNVVLRRPREPGPVDMVVDGRDYGAGTPPPRIYIGDPRRPWRSYGDVTLAPFHIAPDHREIINQRQAERTRRLAECDLFWKVLDRQD